MKRAPPATSHSADGALKTWDPTPKAESQAVQGAI